MLPLLKNDLVDYIRTDLAHVGGITAADKLAAIGEHHYIDTAFHGPGDLSLIGQAATVHLDLSIQTLEFKNTPITRKHTDR